MLSWARFLKVVPVFHTPALLQALVQVGITLVVLPIMSLVAVLAILATRPKSLLSNPSRSEKLRYKCAVITGASSGIGEHLAYSLSKRFKGIRVLLTGRNEERLLAVAQKCKSLGAGEAIPSVLDIRNKDAVARWLVEMDTVCPVDLIIANAGISVGTSGGEDRSVEDVYRELLDTNVVGVFNTVFPLLEAMKNRGRGQIAVMGSLSGYVFFPARDGAYSATKSYLMGFCESLRVDLARFGVGVVLIAPGFVTSNMTAKEGANLPMLVPTDRAAEVMVDGLQCNDALITFPFPLAAVTQAAHAAPVGLRTFVGELLVRIFGQRIKRLNVGGVPVASTQHSMAAGSPEGEADGPGQRDQASSSSSSSSSSSKKKTKLKREAL